MMFPALAVWLDTWAARSRRRPKPREASGPLTSAGCASARTVALATRVALPTLRTFLPTTAAFVSLPTRVERRPAARGKAFRDDVRGAHAINFKKRGAAYCHTPRSCARRLRHERPLLLPWCATRACGGAKTCGKFPLCRCTVVVARHGAPGRLRRPIGCKFLKLQLIFERRRAAEHAD